MINPKAKGYIFEQLTSEPDDQISCFDVIEEWSNRHVGTIAHSAVLNQWYVGWNACPSESEADDICVFRFESFKEAMEARKQRYDN